MTVSEENEGILDPPAGGEVEVETSQRPSNLRLRRVQSTSLAEEIVTETEKQRRAQPDKP